MPRPPSPDRREDRSRHSRDDRERRRSRSPDRRSSTKDEGRSSRDDKGKERRSRDDGRERRRSRSRSRSPARRRDRSRSHSPDRKHRSSRRRSPSSGSDSDDSEDSRDRRHRRKRSSRDKDSRDSKGRDKDERRKRRDEKRARKEAKALKKKGLEKIEWGKWGIISEPDIYTKDTEFRAWLIGERMINPETLSKAKEKEIFKDYMEAFNTGTLPSDKYVDTAKYEAKMNAIRSGETIVEEGRYDPNKDMADMKASHRRAPVETETFLDRSKLAELRKVQQERVEKERMILIGMKPREGMGVITQTQKEKDMGVK